MNTKETKNISQILTQKQLRKLAGEKSYHRGEEYYADGCVDNLHCDGNSIRAMVEGSELYRVKLWIDNGKTEYSCTCPYHRDDYSFCKHCVAVGLSFLNNKKKNGNRSSNAESDDELSMDEIKKYLEHSNKDEIILLLLESAENDDTLRSKLLLRAGRKGKTIHLPTFKKAIDKAVGVDRYINYHSMHKYSQGIENVIDSLKKLCEKQNAPALIELSEYFLARLEGQLNSVDDSNGNMGSIIEAVQELHYDACVLAQPDPEVLAKKLFTWEMKSDWQLFSGAARLYKSVLGKNGLDRYVALAEKEWAKTPDLKPGEDKRSISGNRYRITHIMELLAEQSGDVEKLVAVKKKDLSHGYTFLEIAEIYKKAGKREEALAWAEKGVKAFPIDTDSRLLEYLANEYHGLNRHEEAMQIVWKDFMTYPVCESFKKLKIHAERNRKENSWMQWREKGLHYIRGVLAKIQNNEKARRWGWYVADHSELVKIFLWEKNVEAAWEEAQSGGCHESLWLIVASKLESIRPEDSIAVYRSLVPSIVNRKSNQAYGEAASLVKKISALYKRTGKAEDWEKYLNTLRAEQKQKRNFMKLLDQSM